MSKHRVSAGILVMFCFSCILALGAAPLAQASGQLVIQGRTNKVYSGLNITTSSTSGQDCVVIIDSTNITIKNSQIGPCGGNGINIYTNNRGNNGIQIYDSYIHPETHINNCCDNNDGIFVQEGTSQVTIQGNVIAYGESNVEVNGAGGNVDGVTVVGNFLLNPRGGNYSRGLNVQAWYATNVVVLNNYTLASTNTTKYKYAEIQEDSINFGFGTGFLAIYNYVTGGHSPSGCGINADEAANMVQFLGNQLVNTGQCGLNISSGINQLLDYNRVFEDHQITGGGNTAVTVWNEYTEPCGPTTVSHNTAVFKLTDGSYTSYWNGGGCDPTKLTGNRWDAAAWNLLNPPATTMPPPPIPPQPRNCVAISPYSTQTAWPDCK